MIEFECLKGLGINRNPKKSNDNRWRDFINKDSRKSRSIRLSKNIGIHGYKDYLKTTHWKTFRANYFKTHTNTCYCCFEEANELHHNNYGHLYRETEYDVVPLCRSCHEEVHTLIINEEDFTLRTAHILYKQYLSLTK